MNREFEFKIDEVKENGEFFGITAVYGNVDLGGDRIERGAFKKTLADSGGRVPLLLDHRIPIGAAIVEDADDGLKVHGILNLDKNIAKDAYSDLNFYKEKGIPYGMSIGYQVVQKDRDGDVRVLRELKLVESSITLFPMNPEARVGMVKTRQEYEELKSTIAESRQQIADLAKEASDLLGKITALHAEAANSTSAEAATVGPEDDAFHPQQLADFAESIASAMKNEAR